MPSDYTIYRTYERPLQLGTFTDSDASGDWQIWLGGSQIADNGTPDGWAVTDAATDTPTVDPPAGAANGVHTLKTPDSGSAFTNSETFLVADLPAVETSKTFGTAFGDFLVQLVDYDTTTVTVRVHKPAGASGMTGVKVFSHPYVAAYYDATDNAAFDLVTFLDEDFAGIFGSSPQDVVVSLGTDEGSNLQWLYFESLGSDAFSTVDDWVPDGFMIIGQLPVTPSVGKISIAYGANNMTYLATEESGITTYRIKSTISEREEVSTLADTSNPSLHWVKGQLYLGCKQGITDEYHAYKSTEDGRSWIQLTPVT